MERKYIDMLKELKEKTNNDQRISEEDKQKAIGHLNDVFGILPYEEICL